MSYKIYLSDYFLKQLKSLLKKYKHLEEDLVLTLENFNIQTTIPLGAGLYKMRLKSSDLKKGSQKSFRLVVFVYQAKHGLVPVNIYFKGDRGNVDKEIIKLHLAKILNELRSKNLI